MLKVGEMAPDFTLPDEQGNPVSLATYRGRSPVVLIFYPCDGTLVCTTQLCEIRDSYAELTAAGAVAFGLNSLGERSHRRFAERHRFPFPLLVDAGSRVARKYGTALGWGPFSMTNRSVYVVGADGRIIFAEIGKPSPKRILAALRSAEVGSVTPTVDP